MEKYNSKSLIRLKQQKKTSIFLSGSEQATIGQNCNTSHGISSD